MFLRSNKAIVVIPEPDLSSPREPVESSAISQVGWDEDTQILWVTFKLSDHTYKYYDVPENAYLELMEAASVGLHFSTIIKKNYWCEE